MTVNTLLVREELKNVLARFLFSTIEFYQQGNDPSYALRGSQARHGGFL